MSSLRDLHLEKTFPFKHVELITVMQECREGLREGWGEVQLRS